MYILLLVIMSGSFSEQEHITSLTAEYSSKESCVKAGELASRLFSSNRKVVKYLCTAK